MRTTSISHSKCCFRTRSSAMRARGKWSISHCGMSCEGFSSLAFSTLVDAFDSLSQRSFWQWSLAMSMARMVRWFVLSHATVTGRMAEVTSLCLIRHKKPSASSTFDRDGLSSWMWWQAYRIGSHHRFCSFAIRSQVDPFKRALLISKCRSSSVGQICSNTAILISPCSFTRFSDGSFLLSYREIKSNQNSKFPVKSSNLDFAGLRMCRNNDPFRLSVAGSCLLLTFLQACIPLRFGQLRAIVKASPSSKFCNTAHTLADFSWISSTSPAVVEPNSASTSAFVMDVSCSSAHFNRSQ